MPNEPRKRPKQARAQATVEALLEATAQLLVEIGYDALSTNKIAARAGASIGSLYQYFPSKEALVAELIEGRINKQRGLMLSTLPTLVGKPLKAGVEILIKTLMRSHQVHLDLNRVLFEQVPRVQVYSFMERLEEETVSVLVPYLETRRADLRPDDLEMACYLCVRTFTGAIQGALGSRPELLTGENLDRYASELADLISRYLIKGS